MRPLALSLTLAAALAAAPLRAEEKAITYIYDGSFEDATFAVEQAIIGKGLVVDYVSHSGEMLARTGADLGATQKIYDSADIYLFCSAVLSRKVLEIDPLNIAYCPYSVFVFDREGKVTIGYRTYPEGPMQEVQALLDEIARDAAGK